MSKKIINLEFICVKKDDAHIRVLYELLRSRKFNISHCEPPSFEEHELFVMNNPYRQWYLISKNKNFIGTVYLLRDNCVGIYVKDCEELVMRRTIAWLLENKKPLPGIKSVRPPHFFINLAPENKAFAFVLEEIGASPIQVTYSFKNVSQDNIL